MLYARAHASLQTICTFCLNFLRRKENYTTYRNKLLRYRIQSENRTHWRFTYELEDLIVKITHIDLQRARGILQHYHNRLVLSPHHGRK